MGIKDNNIIQKNKKLLFDLFERYFFNDIERDNWMSLRNPHWQALTQDGMSLNGDTVNKALPQDISTSNISARHFLKNKTNRLSGSFELPSDYYEGSDIFFTITWFSTGTQTGNVKWNIIYFSEALGTPLTSFTTISKVDAVNGVAWTTFESVFPVISGTGYNIGRLLPFGIFRDPTDAQDTYNEDVGFIHIDLYYKTNTFGSRTEFNK